MAGAKAFKERWAEWSGRFTALQAREKYLIVGAVGAGILLGGYTFWIEPAQLQTARLKQSLIQQQGEQEQLRAQLMALSVKSTDPDAANRTTLRQLREQLTATEQDLRSFDRTLVSPAQASALLQTLLARHRGLTLVSLTTLAPQPLIAAPAAKKEIAPATPARAEAPAPAGGNLFKHGIEVKLAGGYHDLLAYVAEIEASPQKLLWGGMRLASNYPVSELTLTVYTLSLDATWLIV